jgi:predicted anti-sigma-YlaC factor YlaD
MSPRAYIGCKDVAKHLLDHLDVDLDCPRYQQIKQHLELCPNCFAYLDSVKKTITLYRLMRVPHAPHSWRKKLVSALKLS